MFLNAPSHEQNVVHKLLKYKKCFTTQELKGLHPLTLVNTYTQKNFFLFVYKFGRTFANIPSYNFISDDYD